MSGLAKFVPLEELKDRLVAVVCNLKPVNMRGAYNYYYVQFMHLAKYIRT